MFGTNISSDLVFQYGLQTASGLLILAIGAFLAKSAGQSTQKALGKVEIEPPVRILLVRIVKGLIFLSTFFSDVVTIWHSDSFPSTGSSYAQYKLVIN